MEWQPIETAPKDGSRVLCWAPGWDNPTFLIWKHNRRLDRPKYGHLSQDEETWLEARLADYFGDPDEMDDYELALVSGGPTHWMPLPELPQDFGFVGLSS